MCQKTVYWDLINSNMNMNGRDVADGLFRVCTQKIRVDEIMYVSSNNLVRFMRLSTMLRRPDGLRVKKPSSVFQFFAIMLLKRLPDGSKQKWWLPGWVESLRILAALLFTAFEVDVLQMRGRADPEMRSAKRTILCRALQSWFEELPYHTEMHWVNTLSMVPE